MSTSDLLGALFGAILLVVLFSGCEAHRSVPPDAINEPIAYTADDVLTVSDAASGEKWHLTNGRAVDRHPVWSPSGTQLLFLSNRRAGFWRLITLDQGHSQKVFVYNLKAGAVRYVDLSWARPSLGYGSSESEIKIGAHLECAAWSPMDTTQVAVASHDDWVEEQVVLVDVEEQEGRVLADYKSCYRLMWSPDGDYLALCGNGDTGGFQYLRVETGETFSLQKRRTVSGDSLDYYRVIDWAPTGHSLLVGGEIRDESFETDTTVVYRVDAEKRTWSRPLGRFGYPSEVVGFMPRKRSGTDGIPDLLVRRDSTSYPGSDSTRRAIWGASLWRYRLPEGRYERLTDGKNTKLYETSYHVSKGHE